METIRTILHSDEDEPKTKNDQLHTMQHELEELRARYAEVYDFAPVGYFTFDKKGRILEANLTAARLLSVERAELIGTRFSDHVANECQEEFRAYLREVFASGACQMCEVKLRGNNGRFIRLESVAARQPGGGVVCRATASDITTSKQEEEVRHFLAKASALLGESIDYETTLASIARLCVPYLADWCVVDIAAKEGPVQRLVVTHVDPAKAEYAQELKRRYPPGLDAEHIVSKVMRTGKPDVNTHITDDVLVAAARDEEHLQILRALEPKSHMIVPLMANGQALGAITFVSAESGRSYTEADLDLAEDLAQRAAIAVTNARLYHEAQQAIKARDEFISIASHELRTPITSLILQLQSLMKSAEQGALKSMPASEVLNRLQGAHGQSKRLAKLVNELLDLSRITAGRLELELEEVDLAGVAREVVQRFDEEAQRAGCEVAVKFNTPVIGLWDRFRLDQVVANLLSNALKYGRGKPVEISVQANTKTARLTVTDHGIGIAPDSLERIFVRFERAVSERNYSGLGLGLYIVRRILDSLGGSIQVESELAQGATFIVELPLKPQ